MYIIHKKMDKNTTLLAKMSYYCFNKPKLFFFNPDITSDVGDHDKYKSMYKWQF